MSILPDLKGIFENTNDVTQFISNVVGASDRYVGESETATLVLSTSGQLQAATISTVPSLSAATLGTNDPESLFYMVFRGGRTVYISNSAFPYGFSAIAYLDGPATEEMTHQKNESAINTVYQMELNRLLKRSLIPVHFGLEREENLDALGPERHRFYTRGSGIVSCDSVVHDLSDPPRSMVYIPLRTRQRVLGMVVFTYKSGKGMMTFGDPDAVNTYLGWKYLEWLHLIVNAATLALAKKIELGQPIT